MNRLARIAYQFAYLAARIWWFVRRPHTDGSVIAIWHDGRVLVVKSSYRRELMLPGGFVRRGEHARDAAVRELQEEIRVALPAEALTMVWRGNSRVEHRYDTTTIWEVVVDDPPSPCVDQREIVWAGWKTPAEARQCALVPPLRAYLADR